MDEKTVIVRPKATPRKTGKQVPEPVTGAPLPADVKSRKLVAPPTSAKAQRKHSSFPLVALGLCAALLVGFGSALLSIYFFSSGPRTPTEFTAQELNSELVPVAGADDEAADEALVRAAIEPRIINLSGDPIIVRQLASASRQSIRLDNNQQRKAAGDIGIDGSVFRVRDALDAPDPSLQAGMAGSQEDISNLSTFEPTPSSDKAIGFSTVAAETNSSAAKFSEFAQNVKAKTSIAEILKGLGIQPQRATTAEAAFNELYGRSQLNPGDSVAVRIVTDPENANPTTSALIPVQLSVYSQAGFVGAVALDDLDHYAQAADPWAGDDIFSSQLLPQKTRPEDRPRLLDAIYAAALRNRLPASVTGEAIMLLSRAQDLEQKTQDGDTITIVYSPTARDSKTGLGRIVYINIGRTTGNLECYAFSAEAGSKFDCVSASGDSSVPDNGMQLPVNGVISARFGPQPNSTKDASSNMNFGVDWTAPAGSPVVAAYDGDVQSVAVEGNWGTVLRLIHAANKTTMYAYLQRVEAGVVAGSKVKAGQTIGYVGVPQSSREARLHFELRENDVPVDPLPEAGGGAGMGGGTVVDQFVHRIITIESANRCDARNPLSTAVGLGQFIESTWMTTVRIHRPDLVAGHSRQQILDMRLDCNLSRAMTTAFTRDNAAVLSRSGANVTPGNLYLAHFLGVGGAVKAVKGEPSRSIADVFGSSHVRANPFEIGKSVGYLVSWAAKKMSSTAAAPRQVAAADPAKGAAPGKMDAKAATAEPDAAAAVGNQDASFQRYDSNPNFTKLKNAVIAFLQ
jgi:murein DD-endopeptidase MepM/ murein hydrolase activator NlpD